MNTPEEVKLLPCFWCNETPIYSPAAKDPHNPPYGWEAMVNHNCKVIGATICIRGDRDVIKAWNTHTASHPQSTEEICAKVREDANSWTPEYRAFLFKKGMEIVDSQPSDLTWVKDAAEEIAKKCDKQDNFPLTIEEMVVVITRYAKGKV